MTRFILAVLAYIVPTFALGFVWHLILFDGTYKSLAIYRSDIIIPFGLLAMSIQGVIFAWLFERAIATRSSSLVSKVVLYGVLGALLSWSFTTIAVAAKNVMSSVPTYLLIETGYTIVQWIMVAPLMALVFHRTRRST